MSRALAGQTISYTSSMLLTRGVAVVWLIVLPHFLSAAEYGVFGLITTAAALINLLVPLEVTQGLARYYPTAELDDAQKYSSSAWTFTLLMLGLTAFVLLIYSPTLCTDLLGNEQYLLVFRLAVGFCVLNTLLYFVQNQFRWDFRSREFFVGSLLFAFTTLALSIGGAFLRDPLSGVVLGQIVGIAIAVGYGGVKQLPALSLGISMVHLKRMLRFSLPVVASSLALYLSTYVSRFFVQHSVGLREVGLFIWASQVASLPPLLLLGVQASLTPFIMKNFAKDETPALIARLFEGVVALELTLCLGLGLLLPDFIYWAGYTNYAAAAPLVLMLAPAQLLFQLYVFSPGFAVAKRTDLQLAVSIVAALAAIGFNYLLVGSFAGVGAAFATMGASLVFFGCWFAVGNRLYHIPIRWLRIALLTIAFAAFSIVGGSNLLPAGKGGFSVRLGLTGAVMAVVVALRLIDFRRLIQLVRRPRREAPVLS